MNEEQINKLEESQNKLITDLLIEAEEHKNEASSKLLKEVATNMNINLETKPKKSTTKKSEIVKIYKEDKVEDGEPVEEMEDDIVENDYYDIDDYDVPHDLVPIPSKGLIYKGIKSKIPVAYLTASDEDLITSPNLYLDGKITELLLRKKILDGNINPDNLCKGDRDAIIIWLRASGYGSNFPVSVKDPISGDNFESVIDLSSLKFKEFNLKADSDGYFDFKLPKTGHEIKFRFLTHKDELGYIKFLEKTNQSFKKIAVNTSYVTLKNIIDNESDVNETLKTELNKTLDCLGEYLKTINIENDKLYLKNVTYLLEKSIISINGVGDKNYIKKYIVNMPAFDSRAIRQYITENTPGVDFRVSVNRPESLGGGSFETFLELDPTIFLNIT
jgi:hypothetical protein